MNNYRKIVVADNEEGEEKYKSDYRGRVQDKNVTILFPSRCSCLPIMKSMMM